MRGGGRPISFADLPEYTFFDLPFTTPDAGSDLLMAEGARLRDIVFRTAARIADARVAGGGMAQETD